MKKSIVIVFVLALMFVFIIGATNANALVKQNDIGESISAQTKALEPAENASAKLVADASAELVTAPSDAFEFTVEDAGITYRYRVFRHGEYDEQVGEVIYATCEQSDGENLKFSQEAIIDVLHALMKSSAVVDNNTAFKKACGLYGIK